mgnify:CR=1 FL=1
MTPELWSTSLVSLITNKDIKVKGKLWVFKAWLRCNSICLLWSHQMIFNSLGNNFCLFLPQRRYTDICTNSANCLLSGGPEPASPHFWIFVDVAGLGESENVRKSSPILSSFGEERECFSSFHDKTKFNLRYSLLLPWELGKHRSTTRSWMLRHGLWPEPLEDNFFIYNAGFFLLRSTP